MFFDLNGNPLPKYLLFGKNLTDSLQESVANLLPELRKWVLGQLSSQGIDIFVAEIKDEGYYRAGSLFSEIEALLKDSVAIWMCVGQMSFRMMEKDEVIDGLIYAADKNDASIKIIHGPRTDPRTKRVFELAEKKKVNLYRLSQYVSDHFMLFISKSGDVTLLDEAPHPEIIRALKSADKHSEEKEFYRGKFRPFYIIRSPGKLGQKRLLEAEKRIGRAININRRLPNHPRRGFPIYWIYFLLVVKFFPITLGFQPLGLYLNSLATRRVIDNNRTNGRKPWPFGVKGGETMRERKRENLEQLVTIGDNRNNPFQNSKDRVANLPKMNEKMSNGEISVSIPTVGSHETNPFQNPEFRETSNNNEE